jgi:nitrogen regulatory protein PII
VKRVDAIIRPERLGHVSAELEQRGYHGFTISDVRGHGTSPGATGEWRGQTYELHVSHKLQISIIVDNDEVDGVVEAITRGARTGPLGEVGDGLVTVTQLTAVYQIRAAANGATAAPADAGAAAPPGGVIE